jgi:hypothetical protein|tara:strand:+ start:885 stop:995 length:111 start_codon:yes stop_codon:yes gene_type:complete
MVINAIHAGLAKLGKANDTGGMMVMQLVEYWCRCDE